jgi:thiol-disulfide isomerase/thioredoxin
MPIRIFSTVVVAAGLCASISPAQPAPDAANTADIASTSADATPLDAPPIFARLSFNDAFDKAQQEDKLLVVTFTATSCGPCARMNAKTWSDEDLIAWAADHAVVIAIETTDDSQISRDHKVRALPTTIAYRDGAELGRVVGFKKAAKTLTWLQELNFQDLDAPEQISLQVDPEIVAARAAVRERCYAVRETIESGKFDEAQPILLDLWQSTAGDPNMVGSRTFLIPREIGRACAAHEPTRQAFIAIRDQTETTLKAEPNWDLLKDWLLLNKSVGQTDKTLDWFDRVKNTPEGRDTISRVSAMVEPLILERGNIRDLSATAPKPLATLAHTYAASLQVGAVFGTVSEGKISDAGLSSFRDSISRLHAALILDDRANEAASFRAAAIAKDDSLHMRLALVEAAIKHIPGADPAHATIGEWALPSLDQADAAIAKLPNTPRDENDPFAFTVPTKADLSSRAAAARKALSE